VSRDAASGAPTPPPDTRDIDDPARLADEAREQREKMAAELRAAPLRIEVEPATIYRP
jgi:hypothetical protein